MPAEEESPSPEKRILVDIVNEEEAMNDGYASDTYEDSFAREILNMNLFYKKAEKSKQGGEAELFEIGKGVVQERLDRLGEGLLKRQNDKKDRKKKDVNFMEETKNDGFGQRVDELQYSDHGGDIEMEKLEDKQVTLYAVKGIDTGTGPQWDIDNWFSTGAAQAQNPA